jgi:type II secretory pathway component PulK
MKREQGVALISVLLIVAIASLITTTLLARQHLAIRRPPGAVLRPRR